MGNKTKILIADSGEDFYKLLSDRIKSEEDLKLVGKASNGEDAVQMVAEMDLDILLIDVVLPKIDGLSVLERLNRMQRRPSVIITSNFSNEHVVAEAASLGASYFMATRHGLLSAESGGLQAGRPHIERDPEGTARKAWRAGD